MNRKTRSAAFLTGLACAGGLACAQLLPGGLGVVPDRLVGSVLQPLSGTGTAVGAIASRLETSPLLQSFEPVSLLDLRRERLRLFVREHRAVLEMDDAGNPVRRGEILAIDPAPDLVTRAQAAGFVLLERETLEGLDQTLVLLGAPRGKDIDSALKALRALDPAGRFAPNHVYEPAGGALVAIAAQPAAGDGAAAMSIGMIDGGVATHPALARASIEQRGFAPGAPRASGHGTAVASLLVGEDGRFAGAAAGARLLVADVYGGDPAAGSAQRIARAFGWLATRGARVITISLVGSPNPLIEHAVRAARRRGILVVAAVGNDGPAAPPQYPASYPDVVAVTGVDAKGRALPEAGRASHLDFAAPGAGLAAALPGKGYAEVRGTSFATPLVAARLAHLDDATLARARAEAEPGRGRVGNGILCRRCAVPPKMVMTKK